MTTDTSFDPPVAAGDEITVKCPDGFINQGSETITCQNEIHFKYGSEPRCEPQPDQGKTKNSFSKLSDDKAVSNRMPFKVTFLISK